MEADEMMKRDLEIKSELDYIYEQEQIAIENAKYGYGGNRVSYISHMDMEYDYLIA
jgi:hypothetical protein